MVPCASCDALDIELVIRSPGELAKAIRVVQGNLSDGTLEEIEGLGSSNAPFLSDVSEHGPWPDHMEYHFKCVWCGSRYKLTAETFHGAGGSWSPT